MRVCKTQKDEDTSLEHRIMLLNQKTLQEETAMKSL